MKKILCLFLATVLLLGLVGCDAISDTVGGTQGTRPTYVIDTVPPEVPEEELFTVTLQLNGKPITEDAYFHQIFKELMAQNDGVYAQWNDGYSFYLAKFDENGVAKAAGLDGTFHVTLSALPGDYVYNVNDYYATNDERQIVIDVYRLLVSNRGDGTGWYYPLVMEFGELGVYEITINDPEQIVRCRYTPDQSGLYQISSWESVAEDKVNPKADVHYGSPGFVSPRPRFTLDDGGAEAESGFCKNFSYTEVLSDEEVGNVFCFGVRATAKDGVYPIKVKVAVLRIGDADDGLKRVTMIPQEVLRYAKDHMGFQYAWNADGAGGWRLDETGTRLWKKEDGGDGYYHFYDEEKYASTNGWGPTLYAIIDEPTRILNVALSGIEWAGQGNSYLHLARNKTSYNYKLFIEGYYSLATEGIHGDIFVGSYYCSANCFCNDPGKKHNNPSQSLSCTDPDCPSCDKECKACPEELYGAPGYADAANSDGCYPVTEELKEFLQLYAQCHVVFSDGMGDAEKMGINSDENSMWLWVVGYYADDEGGLCEMGEVVPNFFDKKQG